MNEEANLPKEYGTVPPDDPTMRLVTARAEKPPHIGIVGDTYTVLLSGEDTAGRYCLIDMHVPPGGGPPPHRHDFEETFRVVDGELEVTFRGEKRVARAGDTVHVPANAPHQFRNASKAAARLMCICAPAGQEKFFEQVGVRVGSRTEAPRRLMPQRERSSEKRRQSWLRSTGQSF